MIESYEIRIVVLEKGNFSDLENIKKNRKILAVIKKTKKFTHKN